MLECVSLANIHLYDMHIGKLTRLYASAWHLVYSADDLARSAHSNLTRSRILMDIKKGKMAPDGWDPAKPPDTVYKLLVADEQFWQEQVHGPALASIAAGSKGPSKTPTEQHAISAMMGGVQAIQPSVKATASTATTSSTPSASKLRREASKKRTASERKELRKFRAKDEGTKGKGKAKDQPKQLYALAGTMETDPVHRYRRGKAVLQRHPGPMQGMKTQTLYVQTLWKSTMARGFSFSFITLQVRVPMILYR